jgi:hypothetical protein
LDPLIDPAALGVTELLANVHQHARPSKQCTVELAVLLDQLTVSVRDLDPRMPQPAAADPLATCGRGLSLIAALSESWGMRPDGAGKVVWFTLPALTCAREEPGPAAHGWSAHERTAARTGSDPRTRVRGAGVG